MTTIDAHISDLRMNLEAVNETEHALVLSNIDGDMFRVVGTVAELRQAAHFGLVLPIPAPPFWAPEPEAQPAAASSNGEVTNADVLAGINALTEIANRIVTRYGY